MADYASRFVTVKGAKMHYIETGQGEPVLFIHGMPTSSYLWRNIIPKLADKAHCVALDLIGMGESDKPDIDYTVNDHISYVECFIEALGLRNITLVMHGWGSVIGFDYARRHPKNIKALAFFVIAYSPDNGLGYVVFAGATVSDVTASPRRQLSGYR